MDPNSQGQPNTPTNAPGGQLPSDAPQAGAQPQQPPRSDWQQGLGGISPVGVPGQPQQPGQGQVVTPQGQPTQVYGPTQPSPEMNMGMGMAPGPVPRNGKGRKLVLAVAALIAVLLIGAGVYFLFLKDDSSNEAAKKSSKTAEKSAIDMSTLNSVRIALAATDATGLTEQETGKTDFKSFVSSDGLCAVSVGTLAAEDLPGNDLNAMIEPQLQTLREAGASIDGPSAGKAMILKGATDSKATYSMPTLVFDFSKDGMHVLTRYSAVILKNGERAVVNRTCGNKEGEVDQSKMTNLDNIAAKAKVTRQ
ncbi:MAG TPA: hypothetical protein VFT16_02535 [Candidatus Saccharimonadales bacterium]|nr:hypothetical protein [Candidatus Saccharimonadales bacterium]